MDSISLDEVCLINPPTIGPGKRRIYFPMALLTLAGVLKKMGVRGRLWDFDLYFKRIGNATEIEFRKFLRASIDSVAARVFGISAMCSNLPMAIWIAREIKECRPDAFILLGGPQPSSVPRELLESFAFLDAIVVGEGETTLQEMIGACFERDKLAHMPGVAVRIGKEVRIADRRPLVANMDDLPFPDYSLIDFKDYLSLGLEDFRPHVEVGRGCPYNCTFCSTNVMWERDFRVKSPKRILAEMDLLHQTCGFSEFEFIHDNFTTSQRFVDEFCGFMKRENSRAYRWYASSRTDCIDVPRLERMYEAGLRGLFFGVETGSERMQKIIKKGLRFTHFEPIIRKANELRIGVTTAFILGFPEEESDDIDQTVRRALHYKSLGTPNVYFSKLTALTGTSLFRDVADKLVNVPSGVSSFSPQNYGLPYVRRLIRDYPHLFPFFYHVPNRLFSEEYLSAFLEFAHLLVNGDSRMTLVLMENLGMRATQLFSLWDDWTRKREIPYKDCSSYSYQRFRRDYQKFLDEVIFGSIMSMTHREPLASYST